MAPNSVIHLVRTVPSVLVPQVPVRPAKNRPFMDLLKYLRRGRIGRVFLKPVPKADTNPYLLLLLADQELNDGREEQARYLIESAYEFFDRKARANVYPLHQSSDYKAC
jgi:hypothetical protein